MQVKGMLMIDMAIDGSCALNKHELARDELVRLSAELKANSLPASDLQTGAGRFFDFRTEQNEVLGYAGIEIFGRDGLLRSVLVLPAWRKRGIGRTLVEMMAAFARARGVERLYLLTMDRADFFAARGFGILARAEAPAPIAASSEFAALCPASAVLMCRDLRAAPALALH
jgi:amino-acid N-acetyltransferase